MINNMRTKHWIFIVLGLFLLIAIGFYVTNKINLSPKNYKVGEVIDSLNGVNVYFNGSCSHVSGRNVSSDGYNIGLKYQCVEFVKRYYYSHLNHPMPYSYGHAKEFFSKSVADGDVNKQRGLVQYKNFSKTKPKVNDLVVFGATEFNKYGHVAIISEVTYGRVEIIQQNSGRLGHSRETFFLYKFNGKWVILSNHLLGWLRKV